MGDTWRPSTPPELKIAQLQDNMVILQKAMDEIAELLEDRLLQMPGDIKNVPMFVVIEDSPAWECLCRVTRTALPAAGRIYPIKRSEFQSLKTDLFAIVTRAKED